jgi:hypothetical protein
MASRFQPTAPPRRQRDDGVMSCPIFPDGIYPAVRPLCHTPATSTARHVPYNTAYLVLDLSSTMCSARHA